MVHKQVIPKYIIGEVVVDVPPDGVDVVGPILPVVVPRQLRQARLLGQEPTITATQVVELLAERGITREVQDVAETLRQLVERDVIREIAGQPPRYEYKVELVRLWIERYKAFGRVVEENLAVN